MLPRDKVGVVVGCWGGSGVGIVAVKSLKRDVDNFDLATAAGGCEGILFGCADGGQDMR